MKPFGERLKKFRVLSKLSQREVAERIGVPLPTYKDWENGAEIRGEPYPKIADVLGISLDDLFGISHKERSIEDKAHSIISIARSIIDQVKK